jgi:hypothetical protein
MQQPDRGTRKGTLCRTVRVCVRERYPCVCVLSETVGYHSNAKMKKTV